MRQSTFISVIKKEDLSTEQEKNETVHRSIEDLRGYTWTWTSPKSTPSM